MMPLFFRCICLLIILMGLPGCVARQISLGRAFFLAKEPKKREVACHDEPYPITIWIHGTRLLPKGVLERFFYSKPGLHYYTTIAASYKQYQIASDIIAGDPEHFRAEGMYLFGWSGKLSFVERKMAAHQLYLDLKKVRAEYRKKFSQEPTIRIITHSHGGNIALNLAIVQDPDDTDFVIDELIMLACPVQIKTAQYICDSSLFKQVYSLYSRLDMVQIIDPQGLYSFYRPRSTPTFSGRCFNPCDNLEQIQINLDFRACFHIDFIRHIFISNLGSILNFIKDWKEDCQAQGVNWHCARKTLNLYSRPISTFLPRKRDCLEKNMVIHDR